jgi:hypothetical protein
MASSQVVPATHHNVYLNRVAHPSTSHREGWVIRAACEPFFFQEVPPHPEPSHSPPRPEVPSYTNHQMRPSHLLLALTFATTAAHAQWDIEESHTTASLRGIHNVGAGVAWASGTNGTVLRTEDGGYLWQTCSMPPGAEKLDFRGVQAFDENTAIVMSSGPGDQSRLYKTTDGCQTWKLVFTNPDKDGFWDAIVARVGESGSGEVCNVGSRIITGTILGDPTVHKSNQSKTTEPSSFYLANFEVGVTCPKDELSPSAQSIFALPAEAAFAASNSLLEQLGPSTYWMAVGTRLIQYSTDVSIPSHDAVQSFCDISVPVSRHSASAGVFSLAIRPGSVEASKATKLGGFHWKTPSCQKADMVVVGGDYMAVNDRQNTAAFTGGTNKFHVAQTPPGGYRSSVAYDPIQKLWITVGPNGTDISTDDGKNWRPLTPSGYDPPDADKNWNALSLPFVVGPHGRIGKLRTITQNTPSAPAKTPPAHPPATP